MQRIMAKSDNEKQSFSIVLHSSHIVAFEIIGRRSWHAILDSAEIRT